MIKHFDGEMSLFDASLRESGAAQNADQETAQVLASFSRIPLEDAPNCFHVLIVNGNLLERLV